MKLFGQHVHAPIVVLVAAEYVLTALAFVAAGSLLVAVGADLPNVERPVLPSVLLFSAAVVLGLAAVGLYQPKQRLRAQGVAVRLVAALALAAFMLAVARLFLPISIRAQIAAVGFLLSLALLGSSRAVFGRMVDHERLHRRVLVYGAGNRAASLLRLRRRSDQRGFKIAAFLPAPGDRSRLSDERVIELKGRLIDYAIENDIDEIVVAMDERRGMLPINELLECRFSGIAVTDVLNFLEQETGKVMVDLVNPAWLIFSEGFAGKPLQRAASRVLDVVVATLLGVLSLPVMLIVACAILIEDGAPVLYRQQRVGFRGRPFTLYKFRSMIKNAESDGRAKWADKQDSRVTRVGRVIRKLRFDELPQIFNVLRGDMSIVGPRPERPEFVERLSRSIPYYHERHSVKPGITGWAQLRYPYGSSDHDALEKLQFDLYYLKHRSLMFDLLVILQTVEVVLWGKGAR